MQLSQTEKTFCQIFSSFWKSSLNFEYSQKEDNLHNLFISKATASENVVRSMCKKFHFSLPFQNEHRKRVLTLLKTKRQHLYYTYWSTGRQLSRKKFLLVIRKILRLFVNTLSAVDKFYFPNRDNLTEPIQMILSQKPKCFCQMFSTFLKSTLNFDNCQKKKMTLIACLFLRLRPPKTWLDQCVKSRDSDCLPKTNMVNVSQHCWNLNESTCSIFN